MMHRLRMRRTLEAFHDGSLTPERRRAAADHLTRCRECEATLRKMREADRLLEMAGPPVLVLSPEASRMLLRRALGEAASGRRGRRAALVGLAAAVVLGAALIRPPRTAVDPTPSVDLVRLPPEEQIRPGHGPEQAPAVPPRKPAHPARRIPRRPAPRPNPVSRPAPTEPAVEAPRAAPRLMVVAVPAPRVLVSVRRAPAGTSGFALAAAVQPDRTGRTRGSWVQATITDARHGPDLVIRTLSPSREFP